MKEKQTTGGDERRKMKRGTEGKERLKEMRKDRGARQKTTKEMR